jgi:serine/threonine-protein kinase HipA
MTSRRQTPKTLPSRCYVYITLPGQTKAVTAGRYELTLTSAGLPVGHFVYGRNYLSSGDAVELDPVELKLAPSIYETALQKGVFGAIRDASPDYWGRLVIQRHLGKSELSEMDYLLLSPQDRPGALGFGLNEKPPAPVRDFNKTLHLEELQSIAHRLIKDRPLRSREAEQVERLLLRGTTMGGARPKAVVEDDAGLWIAKFSHPKDTWNNARVERAMLVLAKSCGISVADSKVQSVAGKDVLLVKRFDRERTKAGYLRYRMVSALTLLRAEESPLLTREKWSYVLLVEELRRVSAEPRKDAIELFRRMCFNALISNTDDHPRNHAILARSRAWKLSPAYDLTPSTPVSVEHRDLAMMVGDVGRYANAQNLLSQRRRFHLSEAEAQKIVADMEACVAKTWYKVARAEGVTLADCKKINDAFVYPGFSFPLQTA